MEMCYQINISQFMRHNPDENAQNGRTMASDQGTICNCTQARRMCSEDEANQGGYGGNGMQSEYGRGDMKQKWCGQGGNGGNNRPNQVRVSENKWICRGNKVDTEERVDMADAMDIWEGMDVDTTESINTSNGGYRYQGYMANQTRAQRIWVVLECVVFVVCNVI